MLPWFLKYPNQNDEILNLDWVIDEFKKVHEELAETKLYVDEGKLYIDGKLASATEQADFARIYKEAAEASKNAAAISETNAHNSELAAAASALEAHDYVANTASQLALLQSRVDNIIPDGTQTEGNTELLDIRVGYNGEVYDSAGDAVRNQVEDLHNELDLFRNIDFYNYFIENDMISDATEGHLQRVFDKPTVSAPYYIDASHSSTITDTVEEGTDLYPFTDYLKCKKYLILCTKDLTSRLVLYFYSKSGDTYTPIWNVKCTNTNSGVRNYLGKSEMVNIIELPDDTYIRYSVAVGEVEIFTWDGEDIGVDVSSGIDYLATDGSVAVSTQNKRYSTVIPSTSLCVFTDENIWLFTIIGIKSDGTFDILNSVYGLTCFTFPEIHQYQSFMLSIEWRGEGKVIYNNLKNHLWVVTKPLSDENIIGEARKLINNANTVNSFTWTPKDALLLRQIGDTDLYYRDGTTYQGLPYGTNWEEPHLLGWQVSLHTFLNALNDTESVLYKERVQSDEFVYAPYYGMVCSAYSAMISGFPCPNTNAGFLYNPDIINDFSGNMPLGKIVSDGSHCVVPVEKLYSKGINIIRIAESVKPLSEITTRYSNVGYEKNAFSHYNGSDYFDDMFYTARHKKQSFSLSTIPYLDFTDLTVVGGSARPYKGDKCVYTSDETDVKINLHGSGIDTLYIERPDENVTEVPIGAGISVIDIKEYLDDTGIYYVYTNISNTKESFEYIITTPIDVTITSSSITFSVNDFWYALCNVQGNEYFSRTHEIACIEGDEEGDYSGWFKDGQYIAAVEAIFYKGQYGAYVVPVSS